MPETERYTHGYSNAMTHFLAGRTAASNAAFFLPYLRSGMNLLDCGCGRGTITLGLAQAVNPGRAVGVDIAAGQIAQANALTQGINNLEFHTASVYQLPFPDATFDAIFGHSILEHLGDPALALREMRRVLRPDGVVGLREVDTGGQLLWPDDPLLDESLALQERVWRLDGGNPHAGRRLRDWLRAAGFTRPQAAASYDSHGTPEQAQEWAERMIDHCSPTSAFGERVIQLGWANASLLNRMRTAWEAWRNHPDAFYARARVEAIAWA